MDIEGFPDFCGHNGQEPCSFTTRLAFGIYGCASALYEGDICKKIPLPSSFESNRVLTFLDFANLAYVVNDSTPLSEQIKDLRSEQKKNVEGTSDAEDRIWNQYDDTFEYLFEVVGSVHFNNFPLTEGAFGFVAKNFKNEFIVAFRGTQSLADAIFDINIIGTELGLGSGIFVHTGFFDYYLSIESELEKNLKQQIESARSTGGPEPVVYFTGHSLGGALATLAAYFIDVGQGIEKRLYSFASPRVISHKFAYEVFLDKVPHSFAVIRRFDPVPMFPPTSTNPYSDESYTHIPNVILLDGLGNTSLWYGEDYWWALPSLSFGDHSGYKYTTDIIRTFPNFTITDVSEETYDEKQPISYFLSQNYPNPFNPGSTIEFALPKLNEVTIMIYNLLGQLVRRLAEETYPAGTHGVLWDGRDDSGVNVPSGVYIYRIQAGRE